MMMAVCIMGPCSLQGRGRAPLMYYLSQSICLPVCYFRPGGPMIFGCKLAAPRLKRLDEKRNAEKGLLRHLARGDRVTDGGIVTKTRAESLVTFLEYSLAVKR